MLNRDTYDFTLPAMLMWMMLMVMLVQCMYDIVGAYNILVARPEGRRPLGRPRRRWEDIRWILGK
jgi:hypothetical protein